MSVGVNSRGSLAQTGSGGPSGAGASADWRGFSAHTSAASSARVTATHASALREGPEFAGGSPESVRRDFAKDIRVHALERDTLVHDLQGERHRHARGRQTGVVVARSEEHTSELQSPCNLVCRLLLEKKKKTEYSRSDM